MKKALIILLLLGMPWGLVFPDEPSAGKELSLKDAIYYALENNLGLQIQRTQTRVSRLDLRINRAQLYLPTINFNSDYLKSTLSSTNKYDGVALVETETLSTSVRINQRVPLGGIFSFYFSNTRTETNRLSERFTPNVTVRSYIALSQPLLCDFGTMATNFQSHVANNNYEISKYQLEEAVVNLIFEVESAYWELVYAHRHLEVAKMALKQANDLLKQNEIKVKVGTAAPIEILSSKAGVARNESAVIQAEQNIQTREEALKRILNMSKESFFIIPTDEPQTKDIPINFDEYTIKEALGNRADLKQARVTLANNKLNVKYQKNQALPRLRLEAYLYTYAVGGTKWDFTTNNPLDPDFEKYIVEVIPYSDTLRDILKLTNKIVNVSFNLQIPIVSTAERAQIARAKIQRDQASDQLKNLENTVYSEASDVIRQLESHRKLVEADRIAVALEAENLKSEEKKLSVGLSTNFEVLRYQEQYASAQSQLLRSTIDLVLANARLNQVLNRTLQIYNLNFKNILENKIER
jgi:outer membrane protein TolC